MRTSRLLRAAAAAAAAVAAVLATACATNAAPAPPSRPDQRATDVAYAQMMVPHVVQGVELTEMVPGRAANPSLAQLVHSMNYHDVEELGQVTGQLHLWGAPVPGENGVPLMAMPGMADAGTFDRLRAMSGPAFDRAWIDVMIAHHEGAVAMSRDYLGQGGQALKTVAQAHLQVGGRQIEQMRELRTPA